MRVRAHRTDKDWIAQGGNKAQGALLRQLCAKWCFARAAQDPARARAREERILTVLRFAPTRGSLLTLPRGTRRGALGSASLTQGGLPEQEALAVKNREGCREAGCASKGPGPWAQDRPRFAKVLAIGQGRVLSV